MWILSYAIIETVVIIPPLKLKYLGNYSSRDTTDVNTKTGAVLANLC